MREVLLGHAGDQCPPSSTGHGAGVRLPSGPLGARAVDRVLLTSHSFAQQMSIESTTCARKSSRHHSHKMTATRPVPAPVETVSQWSRCHQTSAGESKWTLADRWLCRGQVGGESEKSPQTLGTGQDLGRRGAWDDDDA